VIGHIIEVLNMSRFIRVQLLVYEELCHRIKTFVNSEGGQGIVEYGAILAFVAILVGLTFALTTGSLSAAISGSFSSMAGQLKSLNAASSQAST
jgi:Flp pilus assembly pilin Flp